MIKAPIPFMGIPIKNTNNPILVLWANFDLDVVRSRDPFLVEFYNELEQYTGIKCNIFLNIKNNNKIPHSVEYVYLTKEIVDCCYNFLEEKEKFEMLDDIDFVLYSGNQLIKALRTAQFHQTPILYREGEEIIELNFDVLKAILIHKHPLLELKEAVDNSLVHLVGVIPIYYAQERDYKYIQLENGLWSGVYGVFFPLNKNWKWIWDYNYISLIEFHFISSLTT